MSTGFPSGMKQAIRLALATCLLTITLSPSALALPPGRAWTPVDRFTVPGHTWLAPSWLNTDTEGIPIILAEAEGGIGGDVYGLRWADSLWTTTWVGGFNTTFSWPILSPPGTYYLLWKGTQGVETPTGTQVPLVMTQFFGDHIGELDTLGMFYSGSWAYGAAVGQQRRWVAISNRGDLRLFHADALHAWNEVEIPGSGADGVAVAVVNDSTAVVAWAGLGEGLRWGVLRGGTWTDTTLLDAANFTANVPRFRPRTSGGHWLAWGSQSRENEDHQPIATFHRGVWSAPERLLCAGLPNGFWTSNPDLSRDGGEYPAVVWVAYDAAGTGRENLCVCMPTDSGFTVADKLPYTGVPTIARDRDGDVWVAWWDLFIGMFWMHTYNRATADDVRIEGHGRHRRVAWTLSEPAPETWWAVLRARGREDFESVARVRAGPGLDMSWTDSSPPAGLLRYKIRRESVDARYRWESRIVRTPERSKGLTLRVPSPLPISRSGELHLANAVAGPLELRLYDLQGRVVYEFQGTASGSGEDTVRFDLGVVARPLGNGIYFAAIRDAAGESSAAVKLVILR